MKENGVAVGSLHPLVSISDPLIGSTRFSGAYFCVEGDDEAVETANELVKKLGGVPFSIETRFKPLYHASAVMGSGNVIALFDAAVEMLSSCGLDRELAHEIRFRFFKARLQTLPKVRLPKH